MEIESYYFIPIGTAKELSISFVNRLWIEQSNQSSLTAATMSKRSPLESRQAQTCLCRLERILNFYLILEIPKHSIKLHLKFPFIYM